MAVPFAILSVAAGEGPDWKLCRGEQHAPLYAAAVPDKCCLHQLGTEALFEAVAAHLGEGIGSPGGSHSTALQDTPYAMQHNARQRPAVLPRSWLPQARRPLHHYKHRLYLSVLINVGSD